MASGWVWQAQNLRTNNPWLHRWVRQYSDIIVASHVVAQNSGSPEEWFGCIWQVPTMILESYYVIISWRYLNVKVITTIYNYRVYNTVKSNNVAQGCPTLLRSDKGTENSILAACHMAMGHHQDDLRGDKSFRYGASTTNTVSAREANVII